MEFENNAAKYSFFGVLSVMAIALVLVTWQMNKAHNEDDKRHAANEAACEKINLKFGDKVKAKEGFYSNTTMTAVAMYSETVEAMALVDGWSERYRFLCSDLEKVTK